MSLAARKITDPLWRKALATLADPASSAQEGFESLAGLPLLGPDQAQTLRAHRLLPALGRANAAAQGGLPNISTELANQALTALRVNSALLLDFRKQLSSLAYAAKQCGVRLLASSGLSASYDYYDSPVVRVFSDIDVAIPLTERPKLGEWIQAGDHQADRSFMDLPDGAVGSLIRQEGKGVVVDLHLPGGDPAARRYPLPFDEIFDRAKPSKTFEGLLIPDASDLVVLAIEHMARHRLAYYFPWLGELHRFVLDMKDSVRVARLLEEAGLALAAWALLEDVENFYGNPLAKTLREMIHPPVLRKSLIGPLARTFGPQPGGNEGRGKAARFALSFMLIDQPFSRWPSVRGLWRKPWTQTTAVEKL